MDKKTGGKGRKKSSSRRQKNTSKSPQYYELVGIVIFVTGLLALAGTFGLNAGFVGSYFSKFVHYLFGVGSLPAIAVILFIGLQYMIKHHGIVYSKRFYGIAILYGSLLAIYHHFAVLPGREILPESLTEGGGLLGGGILLLLRKFFGVDGGIIVLGGGVLSAVLLSTTWSLASGFFKTKQHAARGAHAAGAVLAGTYERVAEAGGTLEEQLTEKVREGVHNVFSENAQMYDEPQAEEMWQEAGEPVGIAAKLQPSRMSAKTLEDTIEAKIPEAQQGAYSEPEAETSERYGDFDAFSGGREEYVPEPEPKSELEPDRQTFTIEYSRQEEEVPDEAEEEIPDTPFAGESSAPQESPQQAQVSSVQAEQSAQTVQPTPSKPYELPKVTNILSKHVKKKNAALEIEIQENARTLQKTLEDFKVMARIINACHGPAVTRYELEPAPGVKVSKITNLADDLALSLAAFSVRIEPIPGKAAIGIEVPNKELEGVQLREVLEDPAFEDAKSKLTVGLGKDIGGQAIFADLAKMPHLLVAGATGSGKSVCINTLITSILFKAKPDEVKFILIDPKMVELSGYNGIPHLMVPVVTDAKRAASVLNWAVQEMEKRYAKFAEKVVRNMETYNAHFPEDKMASIVIIIDELADLMMVAPHDVEDAICRLAQKARAAGIHLVLATQRPSVDVITGIIKANIPSRISFAVSSQIDSRTILDMSGAEKLLGKGDMLFYPIGASKPQRVQGAFVSDQEVEFLLDFIRSQGQEAEPDEEIINFTEQAMMEAEEAEKGKGKGKKQAPPLDELLEEAVELVMSTGVASSSGIQRRFRIGYTRAARLLDTMTDLHIVGPNQGSKPRDILVSSEQAMDIIRRARSES